MAPVIRGRVINLTSKEWLVKHVTGIHTCEQLKDQMLMMSLSLR